ncbi:MAG: hypothetical protein JO026_03300, partial [Patescibacteria group bacterium]|nr:hypothetical protein [Patescibacteria group bacterium]
DAAASRSTGWIAPSAGTYAFYAKGDTVDYPGNSANGVINVSDQTCTPPSSTITANGSTETITVDPGTTVNLSAAFTAGPGDSMTTTGIADNTSNWLSGGSGGVSPRTYSWVTPSTGGNSYVFYARGATAHCPTVTNYAQVLVQINNSCPAGQTLQENGGTTKCCPSGQTLQPNGQCASSPNPPTATITADSPVVVGQTSHISATFAASSGDTLVATGIADNNDGWLSGGATGASSAAYSFTPTLAGTYLFNARIYTQAYPSTHCAPSSNNCDYAWTTITASCPSGQTTQSDGTCVSSPPQQCTASQQQQGYTYQTNPPAAGCCPPNQTLGTDGICRSGNSQGSVTASLYVGPYTSTTHACTGPSITINKGDSALMCWTCTGATSNSSSGFSTGGAMNGNVVLTPGQTTSYSLQCAGPDGSPTANAIVNVTQPPAPPPTPASTATLNANPTFVRKNNTTTLTWSSTNASSCTLSDDKGHTSLATGTSGSLAQTIAARTVFTLACTGAGGNSSSAATVNVTPTFIEF